MPGRQSIKIPKYKHLHVLPLDAEYQTGEARHFRNVGCYDTRHFRFAARTRLIGRGCYVLFHWLLLCVLCVSFVCGFDSGWDSQSRSRATNTFYDILTHDAKEQSCDD